MTIEGAARLRAELQRLKTIDRPAVSAALAEARGHGDLSENADYDAAKERQCYIESRMNRIERKLAGAQVIDPATGDRFTYQIVGDDEADLKHGKISVSSPIARALIGKSEGDTAEVQAPGGRREYEVLAVRYA